MRRAVAVLFAVLLLLSAAIPASAATLVVQRTWHASLGTGGGHGHETLTGYTNNTGLLEVGLSGMRANASYSAVLYAGSCARLGTRLVTWTGFRTDATGGVSSPRNLNSTVMNKVWGHTRPGSIAIRFVAGSSVICGNLGYVRATRVVVPGYHIDLPVVAGPNGYPYCNVAMYQSVLWQPSEPGVTFIFAHARKGMFLPLLTASRANNGAALIGRRVYVYTSDSMVYVYRIVQVRRHVKSVQSAIGVTSEHLWLQTSEGPNFTYPKLIIVADRVSVAPATYAASHPTPHIVHCT